MLVWPIQLKHLYSDVDTRHGETTNKRREWPLDIAGPFLPINKSERKCITTTACRVCDQISNLLGISAYYQVGPSGVSIRLLLTDEDRTRLIRKQYILDTQPAL